MTAEPFAPTTLFDLDDWPHADLFDGCLHAWEVLGSRLKEYVADHARSDLEAGTVEDGAVVRGDVVLGEGSVIEAGAFVQGPCLIGKNVEVRHGAYLRGHVIAGDGSVLGHATEVKGSVFLPGAKAGHFAYVGDSVLGRDVNLGAGTKLANLKLAKDEVCIRHEKRMIETGLRKFGALLGDGAQTGCNSVTNPGTILGRKALLYPCATTGGYQPPGKVVRGRR
ncbi:MAG: UDP-N-acetylglucosamine diphosphorylase [Acidobacteriota bacterium]